MLRGGAAILTNINANQLSSYSSGTAYSLTATPAQVAFGTTSPQLTINGVGTYLILANANLEYVGATFASVRTPTLKLTRTNNTSADLTNASFTAQTGIVTTTTQTLVNATWFTLYTTTNTNDIIQMYGSIDVVPTAGNLNVIAASLCAIRLQQ